MLSLSKPDVRALHAVMLAGKLILFNVKKVFTSIKISISPPNYHVKSRLYYFIK